MSTQTLRNFGIATVLLLVSGGAFFYTNVMIGVKEEALKTQLAAIKKSTDREQTHYRLQKIAEESQADRAYLQQYFLPQVGESITFLTQVETLAPIHSVSLKTESLEEGMDKKTKESWVDATFVFSGTRTNVEQFVALLENLPYASRMMSVELSAINAGAFEARATMRVFIANHET